MTGKTITGGVASQIAKVYGFDQVIVYGRKGRKTRREEQIAYYGDTERDRTMAQIVGEILIYELVDYDDAHE